MIKFGIIIHFKFVNFKLNISDKQEDVSTIFNVEHELFLLFSDLNLCYFQLNNAPLTLTVFC